MNNRHAIVLIESSFATKVFIHYFWFIIDFLNSKKNKYKIKDIARKKRVEAKYARERAAREAAKAAKAAEGK